MSYVNKQPSSVKAFKAALNKLNYAEWALIGQVDPNRRGYLSGENLCTEEYPRLSKYDARVTDRGASKFVYKLHYLVIKRPLLDGYKFYGEGNQFINEINFYEKYKQDAEISDIICPILRYGMQRGDKAKEYSEAQFDCDYIVAQKAVYVGDAWNACCKAVEKNNDDGLSGEGECSRYDKIKSIFVGRFGMRDVLLNPGNCGVIFDYEKNCYKAVCIDYAL